MKNVKELRDELSTAYDELRAGKIGINEAKQIINLAGKIISSAKAQLEYNKYAQSKNEIKFLDSDE